MATRTTDPIELEATLAICAENGASIAQTIAKITRAGTYRLIPEPTKSILDVYFDTPDGALSSSNWALRLRETQGKWWIALKGPATPAATGGVQRVELELPWTLDALERIRQEILAHGLVIGSPVTILAALSPEEALRDSGFKSIQRRVTRRHVRNIESADGELVGEMALDTVEYHVRGLRILHEEVEIEAKGPGGAEAIRAVREHLLSEFGLSLRAWDYGKLATGLALEEMLEEELSEDLVTADGHLTLAAYDELEARLR